jgi:hypothetical protein
MSLRRLLRMMTIHSHKTKIWDLNIRRSPTPLEVRFLLEVVLVMLFLLDRLGEVLAAPLLELPRFPRIEPLENRTLFHRYLIKIIGEDQVNPFHRPGEYILMTHTRSLPTETSQLRSQEVDPELPSLMIKIKMASLVTHQIPAVAQGDLLDR